MKVYLIANEASGDLHAAEVMKAIKAKVSTVEFRFWGGDKMKEVGGEQIQHYKSLSVMGLDVLKRLPEIFNKIKFVINDILAFQPDVVVLIDSPAFNMRVAKAIKKKGIKVCYYIAPKVWAWREGRVHKLKKIVDKLCCILPFEEDYFLDFGLDASFVGNPSAQQIDQFQKINPTEKEDFIALLPGSRAKEIERLLPTMLQVSKNFPKEQFVIVGAPAFNRKDYPVTLPSNVSIRFDNSFNILAKSKAALVTSGTATLETALFEVPQVVLYKANKLTVFMGRMLIKIKFISLVNIIMNKTVVKELIQSECNSETIGRELDLILNDNLYKSRMLKDYKELKASLMKSLASEEVATIAINLAKK
ncbi:MAG: lipid-A-disaccharide synthase [Sphingobacteriales bacterium]|jgi:lipid-A-disaccharide synthase